MRPVLVGLAILGLLALAAAGSAGDEWGAGLDDRDVPGAFVDYAFTFGVIYLVVIAAIAIWALTGPKTPGKKKDRRQRRDLVTIALLVLIAAGYLALADPRLLEPNPEQPLDAGARRTTPEATEAVEPEPGAEFQWWVAIAFLLALAAIGAYLRFRREPPPDVGAADELEAVLTETLDELELDPDPRRAVIQAYVRMESVLAAHGHGRKPHEAPLEYLARVLRELEVRPEAAHALTELFERARFSRHEIDVAMREEALASLAAVRDDLRAAA